MGARLIFHTLLELERLGARGCVEHAILLGAPLSCRCARSERPACVLICGCQLADACGQMWAGLRSLGLLLTRSTALHAAGRTAGARRAPSWPAG